MNIVCKLVVGFCRMLIFSKYGREAYAFLKSTDNLVLFQI